MPLHQNSLPMQRTQQNWHYCYTDYLRQYFNNDLIKIEKIAVVEQKSDALYDEFIIRQPEPESYRLILPNELTHAPEIIEAGLVSDPDYLEENTECYRFIRGSSLMKILQLAILRKKLNDIDVENPEDCNAKMKSHLIQRIRELVVVMEAANWEGRAYTYGLITDHFIKIADKIQKNEKIDFAYVEESSRRLHVHAFNAPEYSMSVRVAFYGALGALAGFALGMLIFGAFAAVTGGIAGIPAAIKLATEGYVLGTSIALGTAACAGASYKAVTSWRKQDKLSRWSANYTDALMGSNLFQTINGIHQVMIDDQSEAPEFISAPLTIEVMQPEEEQFTFEKPETDEYSPKP